MFYYWRRRAKQMPDWVDPHNCEFYNGKVCHDCEYCDYRQRYGWFYSKYHDKCFNYEFIVILQKIFISGIALFFTTSKNVSLSMLIGLNVLFIGITAYYQPCLTDNEFLKIKDVGREAANIRRSKKCAKESFGVNNTLEILFLIGETCLCISSLIAYNLQLTMQNEVVEDPLLSLAPTNNTNTTLLNVTTSDFPFQQQESLAERIAKKYPVENIIITIFDYIGLVVFFSGFLYFSKYIFVYLCGKMCIGSRRNNDDSNKISGNSKVQIVPR
tara:strand:+ start:64 stop:876 length:813 start_codon:yes stop_codon:yes gene_type:complete